MPRTFPDGLFGEGHVETDAQVAAVGPAAGQVLHVPAHLHREVVAVRDVLHRLARVDHHVAARRGRSEGMSDFTRSVSCRLMCFVQERSKEMRAVRI